MTMQPADIERRGAHLHVCTHESWCRGLDSHLAGFPGGNATTLDLAKTISHCPFCDTDLTVLAWWQKASGLSPAGAHNAAALTLIELQLRQQAAQIEDLKAAAREQATRVLRLEVENSRLTRELERHGHRRPAREVSRA
jgi:hypothetical protein